MIMLNIYPINLNKHCNINAVWKKTQGVRMSIIVHYGN